MNTLYIPRFPWFYESILSSLLDSEHEYLCELLDVPDCDAVDEKVYIDWRKTHENTARAFFESLKEKIGDELKEKTGVELLGYNALISPKFYNYWTDEVQATYSIDEKKAIEFLTANRARFSEYIREENTSYDWFIAYFQNDFDEYINSELEPWKVTQIIDFYILLDDEENAKYMNNPIIDEIIMELCPSLEYASREYKAGQYVTYNGERRRIYGVYENGVSLCLVGYPDTESDTVYSFLDITPWSSKKRP